MKIIEKIIRYFRKSTGLFLPNGKSIKEGDLLWIDDEREGYDMSGVVEKRNGQWVINSGHRYQILPDMDDIANAERVRIFGIKI